MQNLPVSSIKKLLSAFVLSWLGYSISISVKLPNRMFEQKIRSYGTPPSKAGLVWLSVLTTSAYRNGCLAIILLLALHKMSIPCLTLPLSSWPCSKISELIILYQPSLFQLLKWTSCTFRISHGIYSPLSVSNTLPQSHFT